MYDIGQKIDKLTIIGLGYAKRNRLLYQCKCECGKIVHKRSTQLKSNRTNSCGCSHTGKWKGTDVLSLTNFNHIRHTAKTRGIAFSITIEYISELLKKQDFKCALTQLPIGFGKKRSNPYTASLDRVDNTKGYIEGNVWWVHKDINYMKSNLTLERFKELCSLVSKQPPAP